MTQEPGSGAGGADRAESTPGPSASHDAGEQDAPAQSGWHDTTPVPLQHDDTAPVPRAASDDAGAAPQHDLGSFGSPAGPDPEPGAGERSDGDDWSSTSGWGSTTRPEPLGNPHDGSTDDAGGQAYDHPVFGPASPSTSWGPPTGTPVAYPPPPGWVPPSTRRRGRGRRALGVVVLLAAALVAGLVGGTVGVSVLDRVGGQDISIPVPTGTTFRSDDSVAGVAARVLPSTVSIEVTATGLQGSGSGFVLREDGYIVTNNHVVAAAADGGDIRVVFSDGSQEQAEVVGRTVDYDLAVLRVDRDGLTPLPFGDSDSVVVGDPVIAIGAPLGLEATVTTGIVSALNRPVVAGDSTENAFINAIQTDAAINPGNSGGPLVNSVGEVIGVNSAIARNPGSGGGPSGSIGLGFAIPARQVARTVEQLIETGTATYPVIGVLLDRSYTGEGVKVAETADDPTVVPDGPADEAGILAGDVITAFNGRPVTEPDELIVGIRAQVPGDTVTLTVRTGDNEREVDIVLDEADSN